LARPRLIRRVGETAHLPASRTHCRKAYLRKRRRFRKRSYLAICNQKQGARTELGCERDEAVLGHAAVGVDRADDLDGTVRKRGGVRPLHDDIDTVSGFDEGLCEVRSEVCWYRVLMVASWTRHTSGTVARTHRRPTRPHRLCHQPYLQHRGHQHILRSRSRLLYMLHLASYIHRALDHLAICAYHLLERIASLSPYESASSLRYIRASFRTVGSRREFSVSSGPGFPSVARPRSDRPVGPGAAGVYTGDSRFGGVRRR
jgi:hypothetical protein